MGLSAKFVWMDGALVPVAEANVPFLNSSLHYGTAVFEGIRAYRTDEGTAVFRLPEHVDRLLDSAKVLGFPELAYSAADIVLAIRRTVAANGFSECYVRPLIYVADGGWNLTMLNVKAGFAIGVWEWTAYLGAEAKENGVRANVSSFTRHHVNVTMTKAKISGNYANSTLAKTESMRLGFDEAILLDPAGFVAECTGENLFYVRRGAIFTPPAATVLEGITRDALITIARDLGLSVTEVPVSRDQLYIADEVFVCGTAAEVVALREIDFRRIGEGRTGPVTRRVQQVFHDAVRGRLAQYRSWLTPVDETVGTAAGPPAVVASA